MVKKPFKMASAVIVCALLLTPPSVNMIAALADHFYFISGWTSYEKTRPAAAAVHRITTPEKIKSQFKFINFSIKTKADNVNLLGDFNNWQYKANPLTKKNNDLWETSVPLPPGKYRYLFLVDGEYTADMTNVKTAEFEEQTVSVIEVKK